MAMVRCEEKIIPISAIDLTDSTCRLCVKTDPGILADSIRAIGLLNAPVVRSREGAAYGVVCGFRRVEACRLLGWQELPVRLIQEPLSDLELITIAVLDNRSHRSLSVIEQSRAIEKLGGESQRIASAHLASVLGLPSNPKVFQKIKGLSRLPVAVQTGVSENMISLEAAVALCRLSSEDALALFELLHPLRLSQKKEQEIITLVEEIAIRETLSLTQVLASYEVKAILHDPGANRNEKGARLRAYLKQRRYPTLAEAEKLFERNLKALKLKTGFHMTPPAYFEGRSYALHLTLESVEDLEAAARELRVLAQNPSMKKILGAGSDDSATIC
jgi:ParB-like chromosome segregation protein Spo0J